MNGKFVLTRGDDLGSTSSANRAILEGVEKGNLKNASLMVTTPFAKEAAEMFALRKDVCIGLHTTFNAEWDNIKWKTALPQNVVPSLYNSFGELFNSTGGLHGNAPRLEHFIMELDAQLDLASSMGFDIKYADQHMVWHWVVEGLTQEFDDWCVRKGLINAMQFRNSIKFESASSDEETISNLAQSIKSLENGLYLFVSHPGYNNNETKTLSFEGVSGEEIAMQRNLDRIYFVHPKILDAYKEYGIEAVRFDRIGELS